MNILWFMKPVNKLILGVGQGLDSKAVIAVAAQWIFAWFCSVDFCLLLLSGFLLGAAQWIGEA